MENRASLRRAYRLEQRAHLRFLRVALDEHSLELRAHPRVRLLTCRLVRCCLTLLIRRRWRRIVRRHLVDSRLLQLPQLLLRRGAPCVERVDGRKELGALMARHWAGHHGALVDARHGARGRGSGRNL